MTLLLAFVTGVMTAAGVYSLLQHSLLRIGVGLLLLSQGANLAVFICGGLVADKPPIITSQEMAKATHTLAEPLPQALVLTAIVIGFGLIAFALILIFRAQETSNSDSVETFDRTDT